jgi:hypothetical protein
LRPAWSLPSGESTSPYAWLFVPHEYLALRALPKVAIFADQSAGKRDALAKKAVGVSRCQWRRCKTAAAGLLSEGTARTEPRKRAGR